MSATPGYAFVRRMLRAMKQAGLTFHVEAVLAQAALESRWGLSVLAQRYNNLFGIKGRFPLKTVSLKTYEVINGKPVQVTASFRRYSSWTECLKDYHKIVRKYYDKAHTVAEEGGSAEEYVQGLLGKRKWATDPNYKDKVLALLPRVRTILRMIPKEEIPVYP